MENSETKVEEENNNSKQITESNNEHSPEEVTEVVTTLEKEEKEKVNAESTQGNLETQTILGIEERVENELVNEDIKTETASENEDIKIKTEVTSELAENGTKEVDLTTNVEQVINLDTNIISDVVTDLDEEIGQKEEHESGILTNFEIDKNKDIIENKTCANEELRTNDEESVEKDDSNIDNLDNEVTHEINEELLKEYVENTEPVKFQEKKNKSKNKDKKVTFLEQSFEQEEEENDFNLQSAKSNESKVVWEIVSETKGDEIVTEFKNERKKSETESYRSPVNSDETKDIWKDYGNTTSRETDVEMGTWSNSGRDKSVFMSYLEERQREKTLSISDFDSVNDLPTMSYDRSTGSSTAQTRPTQCNHMCGSLFGQCGSVRQEALVQTFSHPAQHDKKYDVGYSGPVSLTEILQERQNNLYNYQQSPAYNAWGAIGTTPNTQERMCRFQELDEDLDSLEKVLMGNGASTSNPVKNNDVKNGYGLCSVDCNKSSGVLDPLGSNSDTYEYIKSGVLSLMKRETKEWENKAVDLNNEVLALQKDVKRKEQEILRLQREVHKLKSVLQQATSFSNDGDLLSSLQEVHGMAGQKVVTTNKKQGVSAESSQPNKTAMDIHVKRFEKDFRSKQLIKAAIMDNDFLKNLDLSQVRELVESMYPKECSKGSYVIREGEAGAHLYVAAEGEFEVIKEHKVLGRIGPGKAFGELAILYNCTRTASIRVIKDSKVWVLDRRVFQRIMMQTGLQRLEDNIHFLRSVPLLKNLSDDVLTKISDVLEVEFYPSGHHIIRQGASGDTFFILSQGSVKVTQRLQGSAEDQEIRILERGDYFGEQALLKEDCRTASVIALPPGVECLTLDRVSFIQLIGDLSEFQEKDYGDRTRISIDRPPSSGSINSEPDQELAHIRLDDLDVIATLGVGGFGRVELVQCLYDKSQTFALKCMKKQHIVETHQQEHVYSEKSIMMSCRHPFICRLYRTFKDAKYVYMLTEACLGGEVWTILRDRGCFDDATCCFISACVIEALHYLHSRGIVFRDLKPENLLLDSQGYVKLVDFGFAKRLGVSSGKTWTFCGTPEYVAPEVILNKGHDKAVDCWALGILIHELLTGAPPFSGSDPMKVYNMILKGIDMVDFPRHVTRTAQALIKKLCRDSPAERLGCQKGGLADIKKNKWFQGFDWDGLRQRTLTPPIVPQVRSPTDTANFDQYPKEIHIPEDETSNWDADF